MKRLNRCLTLLGVVLVARCQLVADDAIQPVDPQLGRAVDFNLDVFPVFEAKCLACHNKTTHESDLVLENVESILKGGGSGPAIEAGKPDDSLLYKAAARSDEPHMPPLPNKVAAKPLTPQELGTLRKWIEEGAKPGMAAPMDSDVNWQPVPSSIKAVYSLALDPDDRFVAAGRANKIVIYDLPAQREVAQLTDPALLAIQQNGVPVYGSGAAHRDFVHSLAFSPDGNLLASGDYRMVKLWERQRDVQLQKLATDAPITAIAATADGAQAATADASGVIRLWNLATGQPGPTLQGHTAAVTSLAFNADGTLLVSGSDDNTMRTWSTNDGQPGAQLATSAPVKALVLNKDGTQVIAGHADNVIRVWPLPAPDAAATPVKEIPGHGGPVVALTLMPTTNEVLSGSDDGTVRIWNLENAQQAFNQGLGGPVTSVAVSTDGALVAAGGANNIARIWTRADSKQKAEIKGDPALDRKVLDVTDEQTVAKGKQSIADTAQKEAEKDVTSREESLKKANEAKEAADKALAEGEPKVKAAEDAAKAAADELAAKPDDEALKKKKTDADEALKKEVEARDKLKDGVASAERGVNLSQEALDNSKQRLEDSKKTLEAATQYTQAVDQQLTAAKEQAAAAPKPIRAVAFSSDGKQLAVAGDDGLVYLRDTTTGKNLDTLHGHAGPVGRLIFLEGGSLLSAAADQSAVLWETRPAWKLVARLGASPENPLDTSKSPFVDRVLCLDFSPDGTKLATGGGDPSRSGELLLWEISVVDGSPDPSIATTEGLPPQQETSGRDARRGRETRAELIREFKDAHSDTVFDVEFSWDGKRIVSGAADKFVKVFDVETGEFVRAYEGHTNHVLGVSWKADNSVIASAGADNAIKLWNVDTGEQIRTISNYSKQVTDVDYVGVQDFVVSCGGDTKAQSFNGNGSPRRPFNGNTDFVYAIVASRDETIVATGGEDGVIRVFNGTNGQAITTFEPPAPVAETASVN